MWQLAIASASRCLRLVPASLILVPAASAQGALWTVDDSGGADVDFSSLQAAINAAASGDVILVRPGFYPSISIDAKSLTVAAAHPGDLLVRIAGSVRVLNLAAGQSVELRGLDIQNADGAASLRLESNQGPVHVEDCSVLHTAGKPALLVQASAGAVTLSRTTLRGGPGLRSVAGLVFAYETSFTGSSGSSGCPLFCQVGTDGRPGAVLEGGFAFASACAFVGGNGAAGVATSGFETCSGGDGGDGCWLQPHASGAPQLVHLESTFQGGSGAGFFGAGCTPGSTSGSRGSPMLILAGSASALPGNARSLDVSSPAGEGGPITLEFEGQPGEHAFLVVSGAQAPYWEPAGSASLNPAFPWVVIFAGVVPASGKLVQTLTINDLGPGTPTAELIAQANFVPPGGPIHLSSPTAVLLRDCAVVAGETDCDGNGRADACDLAHGPASDCNSNWVIDACEIASGALPDCNGNGVPDACDIASGASADVNDSGVPDECETFQVWQVDDDAAGDPVAGDPSASDPLENGSAAHPYDAIQEAIASASDGDLVIVADGLYRGAGNRDVTFSGKQIHVRSQNGSASCIVDAEFAGRGFALGAGLSIHAILEGFTIRNGVASFGAAGIDASFAEPTIRACVVTGCTSAGSGGIAVDGGRIEGCTVTGNTCTGFNANGGGISHGGLSSTDNVVRDCTIQGNRCTSSGFGGGIYVDGLARVEGCLIEGNTAARGAGLMTNGNNLVDRCTIRGNVSPERGGGIHCNGGAFGGLRIRDSLIVENRAQRGGGLWIASLPVVQNCTIARNVASVEGGGVYMSQGTAPIAELESSILWLNTAPQGAQISVDATAISLTVSYCDVQGGLPGVAYSGSDVVWGAGNTALDPLFVAPLAGNYHLGAGSPCVDAGDPAFVAAPGETDIDGQPRVLGPSVDVGADEL